MSSVILFHRSSAFGIGEECMGSCSSFASLSAKKNFNKFPSNIKSFLISRYSSCRNKTFVSNVTYKIPGVLEFYLPDELTSPMI